MYPGVYVVNNIAYILFSIAVGIVYRMILYQIGAYHFKIVKIEIGVLGFVVLFYRQQQSSDKNVSKTQELKYGC